jgi:hypothetical protein
VQGGLEGKRKKWEKIIGRQLKGEEIGNKDEEGR